jgi:hypothetical protein
MIFPEFILTPVEHFWLLQTKEIIQGAISKGIDLVGQLNPWHKVHNISFLFCKLPLIFQVSVHRSIRLSCVNRHKKNMSISE